MNAPLLSTPDKLSAEPDELSCFGWIWRIPAWFWLLGASIPAVWWFLKRLDDGSDEPLGLLTLGLALILACRGESSLHTSAQARTSGALTILASVLTIGLLPPMFRAALAVAGTGIWFGFYRNPGLMGLLVLSLPVVSSLQFYAGYPMRLASAQGSVWLLNLGGIVVGRNGVNIELGGSTLGVDPACSGIRMLWHSLAAAMALAAIHRISWRWTISGGMLAVLLVIPTNILRATWLALEESGRFPGSGLGHGNIGLVCFGVILVPLWIILSRHAQAPELPKPSAPPRRLERLILILSAMLVPFFMTRAGGNQEIPDSAQAPSEFTFNGLTLPLVPLPNSPAEYAFAKSFPGSLSSHRWGESQVILRVVNQATRRLHPSRDCLRAAGYETTDAATVQCSNGSEWSRFSATLGDTRLIVHERITSMQDSSTWTDVAAWYWSAVRHPLNGPWRAETVISGSNQNDL